MTTALIARSRWSAERVFYCGMACTALLVVFIGFAPSYYLRGVVESGRPLPPMSPLIHLHGLLFSSWILLFMTQTGLIAARRSDLHRRLGLLGALLAVAMIAVGTLTGLHGVARASGPPSIPPPVWLAVPLFEILIFATLVAVALLKRQDVRTHKRLMLIATIGLLGPAMGRMHWPEMLQGVVAFLAYVFLIPLVVWDFRWLGRLHPATAFGGSFLIVMQVLRIVVWETEGWLRFATWAAGLVA